MVANNPPDIVPIPLADVVGRTKTVPLDYDLLKTARALGVSLGRLKGRVKVRARLLTAHLLTAARRDTSARRRC